MYSQYTFYNYSFNTFEQLDELEFHPFENNKLYYKKIKDHDYKVIYPREKFYKELNENETMNDDTILIYILIQNSKKELIKFKGFQVPPAELEGILLEHPNVADACVIGKPDDEAGEVPKAFVVAANDDADADEIIDFVKGKVANYKRISEVEFVNEIPKNPSGKILRRILRDKELAKS